MKPATYRDTQPQQHHHHHQVPSQHHHHQVPHPAHQPHAHHHHSGSARPNQQQVPNQQQQQQQQQQPFNGGSYKHESASFSGGDFPAFGPPYGYQYGGGDQYRPDEHARMAMAQQQQQQQQQRDQQQQQQQQQQQAAVQTAVPPRVPLADRDVFMLSLPSQDLPIYYDESSDSDQSDASTSNAPPPLTTNRGHKLSHSARHVRRGRLGAYPHTDKGFPTTSSKRQKMLSGFLPRSEGFAIAPNFHLLHPRASSPPAEAFLPPPPQTPLDLITSSAIQHTLGPKNQTLNALAMSATGLIEQEGPLIGSLRRVCSGLRGEGFEWRWEGDEERKAERAKEVEEEQVEEEQEQRERERLEYERRQKEMEREREMERLEEIKRAEEAAIEQAELERLEAIEKEVEEARRKEEEQREKEAAARQAAEDAEAAALIAAITSSQPPVVSEQVDVLPPLPTSESDQIDPSLSIDPAPVLAPLPDLLVPVTNGTTDITDDIAVDASAVAEPVIEVEGVRETNEMDVDTAAEVAVDGEAAPTEGGDEDGEFADEPAARRRSGRVALRANEPRARSSSTSSSSSEHLQSRREEGGASTSQQQLPHIPNLTPARVPDEEMPEYAKRLVDPEVYVRSLFVSAEPVEMPIALQGGPPGSTATDLLSPNEQEVMVHDCLTDLHRFLADSLEYRARLSEIRDGVLGIERRRKGMWKVVRMVASDWLAEESQAQENE